MQFNMVVHKLNRSGPKVCIMCIYLLVTTNYHELIDIVVSTIVQECPLAEVGLNNK